MGVTVFGWDASDFDWPRGPMDFHAARAAGIQFFTHKATESTTIVHTRFGEAMARARDAGIPVLGAYHVVRSPRNARDEVDFFLTYIDRAWPEWRTWPAFVVQVDLEKWPYDAVPAAEGEDFADLVEQATGRRALIYASKGQYGDQLVGTSHELWNANYPLGYRTGTPWELYRLAGGDQGPGWTGYSGRVPAIWQFTSSALIGSQPTCDANAYRGTLDQFRALITGGTDMTPELEAALTAAFVGPYNTAGDARIGPQSWVPLALEHPLNQANATLAGLVTSVAALTAAVQALAAGGTSIDTQAVIAAVQGVGQTESSTVTALQQEVRQLRTQLAAAAKAQSDVLGNG